MYVDDDIKLFAGNEKELEILIQTVRIYSQSIELEFSKEKCDIPIMGSWKWQTTKSCTESRKNQNVRRKGKLQVLGNIEISWDGRKNFKKSISGERN